MEILDDPINPPLQGKPFGERLVHYLLLAALQVAMILFVVWNINNSENDTQSIALGMTMLVVILGTNIFITHRLFSPKVHLVLRLLLSALSIFLALIIVALVAVLLAASVTSDTAEIILALIFSFAQCSFVEIAWQLNLRQRQGR